jgi:phage N-6-adenine-methyltransferase
MEIDPRQEWQTPAAFRLAVRAEFDLVLDVAATQANTVAPFYYDAELDGLARPWFGALNYVASQAQEGARVLCDQRGAVWCNPGFSNLAAWVQKAIYEVGQHQSATAVVMALAAVSTKWWRAGIAAGMEARLLSPRVQFDPAPGVPRSSNPREVALLIFRSPGQGSARPPYIWNWRWSESKEVNDAEAE